MLVLIHFCAPFVDFGYFLLLFFRQVVDILCLDVFCRFLLVNTCQRLCNQLFLFIKLFVTIALVLCQGFAFLLQFFF